MLASIEVDRRCGQYRFITVTDADSELPTRAEVERQALARISEAEGTTYVLPAEAVTELGLADAAAGSFTAAWLTLRVHSSLEAVGLTAAISNVLSNAGIACNVLAGYYHDHLLVPSDAAERAIAAIESLRERNRR